MTPPIDLVALNALELTPIKRARLLARFGSAERVLDERGGGEIAAKEIARARRAAAEELLLAEKEDVRVVMRDDADYPRLLRETFDAPPVLYCRGALDGRPSVAIVGSRKADAYGLTTAERFGRGIASRGVAVVSGMAYGIDAAAHRGALDADGPTIAVLGSGLLNVYPREHARLAQRIADSGGAVLSEFPLRAKPLQKNFPQRNRIIAGLSLGTLIVEAGLKSGSLITARLAADYGRIVWAVPNRAGDPLAEGVIALLRDGATIAAEPKHVLDDIASQLARAVPPRAAEKPVATTSDAVLESVGPDGATLDEIASRSGLPRAELIRRILKLELAGRLTYHLGGAYRRTGNQEQPQP